MNALHWQEALKKLPDGPGVYFFIGPKPDKVILYIGRATSLRDRVRSYFADDLIATRGPLLVDMVSQAADIDFVATDSVLEAIILEANLIKKHLPHANTREKDDKSFNYVVASAEEFPAIGTMRAKDLEASDEKFKHVFGPYANPTVLREGLAIIRKILPFRDKKCKPGQGRPCFNRQIGLCPGVCTGEISRADYAKQVRNICMFFEGKKSRLISTLTREMKAVAKGQEFEAAGRIKKTIFALEHIQDITLMKRGVNDELPAAPGTVNNAGEKEPASLFRIEAYDIAHMSGKNIVGVMTVLEGRELAKANYRMFKIRTLKGADDTAGLKEILTRRLAHSEWTYPNLIVVDGGIVQKNAAEAVLKELGFDIAVVAVTKNERHQPEKIQGDRELVAAHEKEILLLNAEAHRFAIKYHRKTRRII